MKIECGYSWEKWTKTIISDRYTITNNFALSAEMERGEENGNGEKAYKM